MSDQNTQQPTPNQNDMQAYIRAARHAGFDDSISHRSDQDRARLTNAHRLQDARREKNVSEFYSSVAG